MTKYFCDICCEEVDLFGWKVLFIKDTVKTPEELKKNVEMLCPNGDKHRQILIDREYSNLSLETKQRFMDLLKEGKSVGTAKDELGLSLDLACEIINRQIQKLQYMDWKVKE
jgi:hypothetical protein